MLESSAVDDRKIFYICIQRCHGFFCYRINWWKALTLFHDLIKISSMKCKNLPTNLQRKQEKVKGKETE